jgi:hypothetical protein
VTSTGLLEYFRIRLLRGHVLADDDGGEAPAPAGAEVDCHERLEVAAAGGRRNAHRYAAGRALAHELADTLAQGDPTLAHQPPVMRVLAPVHLGGERGARFGVVRRVRPRLEVGEEPLPAAGNLQQLAIARDIPVEGQAEVGEGEVEGDAMAVSLGFGQRAVDVPEERRQPVQCMALAASSRTPGRRLPEQP